MLFSWGLRQDRWNMCGKKEVEKMVRRNASLCFVAPGITSAFARSDLGLLGFPRVLAKDGYAEAALATCKHLRIHILPPCSQGCWPSAYYENQVFGKQ